MMLCIDTVKACRWASASELVRAKDVVDSVVLVVRYTNWTAVLVRRIRNTSPLLLVAAKTVPCAPTGNIRLNAKANDPGVKLGTGNTAKPSASIRPLEDVRASKSTVLAHGSSVMDCGEVLKIAAELVVPIDAVKLTVSDPQTLQLPVCTFGSVV